MTAMYPARVSSSIATQTEKDLREVADKIQVPVAHIIRMGIEEKVASLKAGVELAEERTRAAGRGDAVPPLMPHLPMVPPQMLNAMNESVLRALAPLLEQISRTGQQILQDSLKGLDRDH